MKRPGPQEYGSGVAVVAKLVNALGLGPSWVPTHCGFESRPPQS